jgi:hypothetical protein
MCFLLTEAGSLFTHLCLLRVVQQAIVNIWWASKWTVMGLRVAVLSTEWIPGSCSTFSLLMMLGPGSCHVCGHLFNGCLHNWTIPPRVQALCLAIHCSSPGVCQTVRVQSLLDFGWLSKVYNVFLNYTHKNMQVHSVGKVSQHYR